MPVNILVLSVLLFSLGPTRCVCACEGMVAPASERDHRTPCPSESRGEGGQAAAERRGVQPGQFASFSPITYLKMSITRNLNRALIPSTHRALHSCAPALAVKDTVSVSPSSLPRPGPTSPWTAARDSHKLTVYAFQAILHGSETAKEEAHHQHSALVGRGVSASPFSDDAALKIPRRGRADHLAFARVEIRARVPK